MITIPKQLQEDQFRFVLLFENTKRPFAELWTTINNHKYNDKLLLEHISKNHNYGVLCGKGNLVVLDLDDISMLDIIEEKLPKTFTVETGSGKRHYYFIAQEGTEKLILEKDGKHIGELQSSGSQVVGPSSIHPDTKKEYTILKDLPIANLHTTKILWLKKEFTKEKQLSTVIIEKTDISFKDYHKKDPFFKYVSENIIQENMERNNVVFPNLAIALVKEGLSKEKIKEIMTPIIEKNFPGKIYNEFAGWVEKAMHPTEDKMSTYNEPQINKWMVTYAKKDIIYNLLPIKFSKNLNDEGKKLLLDIQMTESIDLSYNLEDYLDRIKTVIDNKDVQNSLLGLLSKQTFISRSDLRNRMTAKQIAEPVDIFSLEAKEYVPPKWYIENFIPENSGILIGAKPGKKKSLTTMTACLCIPLNCNFLDNFNIINDKAKILYYDLENGEEVIAERFSYLIKSLKEKAKNKNPCNFKLLYSFDKHNLEKEFQTAKNYDIIVLDSYRRVLKGEENNSEITDIFFNDFYKPLRDLKKTVIIIHHFKKGMLTDHEDVDELMDIFRGSSDVAAQFEIIYGILNGKETISVDGNMIETNVFVKCVKNRRGLKIRNFAFNLIKNEKDLRTDFQYLGDIKMKTLKDNKKNILVDIINKKETIHRSELAEIALQNEISIPTMDKYLKELVTTGIIKHDKQGKYESVKVIDVEDKTSMSELL